MAVIGNEKRRGTSPSAVALERTGSPASVWWALYCQQSACSWLRAGLGMTPPCATYASGATVGFADRYLNAWAIKRIFARKALQMHALWLEINVSAGVAWLVLECNYLRLG
jgi:hypothetical protein